MADDEFERSAAVVAPQVGALPRTERYAAAARGSANPAALAWLAEGLGLDPSTRVADLGAGMAGPTAWLADHYGCRIVALEPAAAAAAGARDLFGLPTVRADAAALPLRAGAVDVSLLLGVISVAPEPAAVLAEALRVSGRLGVLDWCAAGDRDVHAGGSTFRTPDGLCSVLTDAGWDVEQQSPAGLPAPRRWDEAADAIEAPEDPDERAVVDAIGRGELTPLMVVARR